MIPLTSSRLELSGWASAVAELSKRPHMRYGHLTVRREASGMRVLEALFLDTNQGVAEVLTALIPDGSSEFPSVTATIPAAHWAERAIGDLWGLHATNHPRWKSLILHEAWDPKSFPFAQPRDGELHPRESHFMTVGGDGVHEIPVGPIHAGIIEPGHFRFSCVGEVVANLDMRFGYLHRGLEANLQSASWKQGRHIVECAATDTAAANALAHAEAIEGLFVSEAPPRAAALRTLALEIERIANHLGDLGALSSDIGFALGAAAFGRLRGAALGLAQTLSGSRFMKGFIRPGGVSRDMDGAMAGSLQDQLAEMKSETLTACKLLFENAGAQERLEGVGSLQPSLATEFGMVGPAARASKSAYDSRRSFTQGLFPKLELEVASESAGDALARAKIRRHEISASAAVLDAILSDLPDGPVFLELPLTLPPLKSSIGVVEAWRGELIHWITTNEEGEIARYAIRDPSFQNWTGLAIAVRHNLVADFPLINKSFDLSYSGNDL